MSRRIARAHITVLAVAIAGFAAESRAAVYCTGTITEFLMYSDGHLMVMTSWRGDWTYLCNTHGTWNGISPETCFTWYSMVSAAKVHNKAFGVYYDNVTNCQTLPTYGSAPPPVYVRLGP